MLLAKLRAFFIVENAGLSHNKTLTSINQLVDDSELTSTDILRTKKKNLPNLAPMISFTPPVIRRGKSIKVAKKGMTLIQQQALEDWYIEYYFTDTSKDIINKRVKLRSTLNKYKNPKEKEAKAQELVKSLTELLEEGWHPFDEVENAKFRNEIISITIAEAVTQYKQSLEASKLRKKSIQTYGSKLKYFSDYYSDLKVNQISADRVNTFLSKMKSAHAWSDKTYNATHQVLNAFFTFLIRQKYFEVNPIKSIVRLKSTSKSTEAHKVFTDAELKTVLEYLDKNDALTSLFVKSIYYTCIRPKELRQLKISMIDLDNNIITIPGSISKNKQTDTVKITPNFRALLDEHNLDKLDKDSYLFSSNSTIGGNKPIGENTPYNRFISCLKEVKLDKKGYSLYGIKHKSNINKYLNGWTVAEIMKANRHGSISQTETYLRELTKFINIDQKEVPLI